MNSKLLEELAQNRTDGDKTDDILLTYKKDKLQEEIADSKQNRGQRKIFSYVIFAFMFIYMASAMVVVFLCGFQEMKLSDAVIITLLTTTLANVIGVFNFVAKYLFYHK